MRLYGFLAAWLAAWEWSKTTRWCWSRAYDLWWINWTNSIHANVLAAIDRGDARQEMRWQRLYEQAHQQWRADIEWHARMGPLQIVEVEK